MGQEGWERFPVEGRRRHWRRGPLGIPLVQGRQALLRSHDHCKPVLVSKYAQAELEAAVVEKPNVFPSGHPQYPFSRGDTVTFCSRTHLNPYGIGRRSAHDHAPSGVTVVAEEEVSRGPQQTPEIPRQMAPVRASVAAEGAEGVFERFLMKVDGL